MPHSGCDNVTTSYQQYANTRTGAALPQESLRPIQVADGSQPCATFGLHNKMSYIQQLYQQGEAAITANIGNLIEPIENKVRLVPPLTYIHRLLTEHTLRMALSLGSLNVHPSPNPPRQADFHKLRGKRPRSLGSHEHQQTASFTLHPQRTSSKGVLGKIVDALESQGGKAAGEAPSFKTAVYSVSNQIQMVRGEKRPPLTISKDKGVVRYLMPQREMAEHTTSPDTRSVIGGGLRQAGLQALLELTGNESGNAFAETSNQLIRDSLVDSEAIGSVLDNVTSGLTQDWDQLIAAPYGKELAARFYQVARLVTAREQFDAERDIFYVDVGGWDMHANIISGMETRANQVDTALEMFVEVSACGTLMPYHQANPSHLACCSYLGPVSPPDVQEMKAQGVWNDMVIQTGSDFARTLVFNGAGTDHSWGGNHFTFGGKVKGGKMLGAFPSLDLQHSPYITDSRRGTLLPTTPWEGLWAPIAEWFGVEEGKMGEVLPNLHKFPASMIAAKETLFHDVP